MRLQKWTRRIALPEAAILAELYARTKLVRLPGYHSKVVLYLARNLMNDYPKKKNEE